MHERFIASISASPAPAGRALVCACLVIILAGRASPAIAALLPEPDDGPTVRPIAMSLSSDDDPATGPAAPLSEPGGVLATDPAAPLSESDDVPAAPLFGSHHTLKISLAAPLKALGGDRDDEPERREAVLSYRDDNGITHRFNIGIRPRGKTRRDPAVCHLPPLRLNFSSAEVGGTVFAGQDKLKMVTHCRHKRQSYQQYVLQEYLAYRVFNLLTENSFRVRLLDVEYNSTDQKQKPFNGNAFLIEDRDQLAARTGHRLKKTSTILRDELDQQAAALVEVFQYLIGNVDWSIVEGPDDKRCCHNAILMSRDNGPYVPVPYDFDYSGIIDTSYAASSISRTKSVRNRVYRGFCRSPQELQATLDPFRQKKQAIYELYRTQEGLASEKLKRTIDYLDSFYATIDDPKRLERRMASRCR